VLNVYNGTGAGNFGWLSWMGDPSEPTLVTSLTPPGNSSTYSNPANAADHTLTVNKAVYGKPGVSNSKAVRDALTTLESQAIAVPVWDSAAGSGNNATYHVSAFALIQIQTYQLPEQNQITAKFLGYTCGSATATPAATNTATLPAYQPLTVCWVQHWNGTGSTEWHITNPNPVPLSSNPDTKMLYNW
jgi:hypothetical protein